MVLASQYLELDHSEDEQLRLTDDVAHVVILSVQPHWFRVPVERSVCHVYQVPDLELAVFLKLAREINAGSGDELDGSSTVSKRRRKRTFR